MTNLSFIEYNKLSQMKQNFVLVIFGITSNLAEKKFIPALYNLYKNKKLSGFDVLGISGRERSLVDYRGLVTKSIGVEDLGFLAKFDFMWGDVNKDDLFKKISEKLNKVVGGDLVYYLAVGSELYKPILVGLAKNGLNKKSACLTRLLIEKPFGKDLASALKLEKDVYRFFDQDQVYMIDHYLAKEMVENMLVFRKENPIFDEMLDKKWVERIEVTLAEDFGIENRGDYYEKTGALRDVGQNHLLQMLAYSTMKLSGKVAKRRLEVFRDLQVDKNSLVRGRYLGYEGKAETYFSFGARFSEGKLSGVPVFFRSGKELKSRVAEVVFRFFGGNALVFRIQPDEGVIFKLKVKKTGVVGGVEDKLMKMCFCRKDGDCFDPYQKLLLLVVAGKRDWFVTRLETREQWRIVDELKKKRIVTYRKGSWGPGGGKGWFLPEIVYCGC